MAKYKYCTSYCCGGLEPDDGRQCSHCDMGMGRCRCIPRAEAIATGAEVPPESESPKLKHELFGKHELFRKRMMESDVHLEQLMALGFREEQLLKAFDSTDGNVEQAIDSLGGNAQGQKTSPFLPASTQQAECPLVRKSADGSKTESQPPANKDNTQHRPAMLECCVVS